MFNDLRVLGVRPFRAVFIARLLSMLGSSIAPVALSFAILDQSGGTVTQLGFVLGARSLMQVVFLLGGGVLADRFPRNRLMILSDLTAFVAQAVLPWPEL